jgi:hypothetical protein
MINQNQTDIDLVYLWVDGNDPIWRAKRNAFIGETENSSSTNCEGRYANNDELKYSIRSIEMYAPWIRKIFIVTDEQTPTWLDTTNPKVKIVDLKDILPAECLPCFNSSLIEKFYHRIPDLSEKFLYANDDMFINKNVTPNDFFTSEGLPIIRLTRKPFRRLRWLWREKICKKPLKNYSISIGHASQLVNDKYGIYYTGMPHHNIDSYLKSDCKRIAEEVLRDEFLSNWKNRKRSNDDIQRIVFSYVALAEKRGHMRYVTQKESMMVRTHKKKDYESLEKYIPMLFCVNDSEYATNDDRIKAKKLLANRFPQKSQFEK